MEFTLFLVVITVLYLLLRTRKLKKNIRALEERIEALELRGGAVISEKPVAPEVPAATAMPERVLAPAPEPKPAPVMKEKVVDAQPEPPRTAPVPRVEPVEEPEWKKNSGATWKKLEKRFAENWTGIIGAVVMVMGVAFLGVYAALKMTPLFRFLIITAFAAFLFALYLFLRKKEAWRGLAHWLRSSSGAIFLFACLGSGGIPGLKWIDDPLYALAFLGVGIIINLVFGFAGGTQVFASLHVVLSLVALGIAPQNQTTMILSAVVVLFGVILAYRDRWEYHLMVSITGYLAYHFYWFHESGLFDGEAIPLQARLTGIAVTGV
ncbi:MAG TPA: hypothetical protein PKY31_01010, partial [Spirochaetota bacterium]|nr:hypothetical protein [Spirochaetota bacterium]